MKKLFLIFFLILTVQTFSFSQTTSNITITSEQLKVTNLIFAEHKKFSEEIPMLKKQIYNLEMLDKSWQKTDSIKSQDLRMCRQQLVNANATIEHLNTKHLRQKYVTIGCSSAIVAILLTFLLVK